MTNLTQMDYGQHLAKLNQYMNDKLESADRFLHGYLTIAGVKDQDVRAQTTTFPLSISYGKGIEETKRTGSATYHLPEKVQVELNRAAAGEKPARQEIVDEIDIAYEAFKSGSNYNPKNIDVANELKKHFKDRNIWIPNPEQDIGALVEAD